jgi:hypothetical protein
MLCLGCFAVPIRRPLWHAVDSFGASATSRCDSCRGVQTASVTEAGTTLTTEPSHAVATAFTIMWIALPGDTSSPLTFKFSVMHRCLLGC